MDHRMEGGIVPEILSQESLQRRRSRHQQRYSQFIKGPIPLEWICRVSNMNGKAVSVALALWYRAGVLKASTSITLSSKLLHRFGVKRKAAYHALRQLEEAGLVSVVRRSGKSPLVTIVELAAPGRGDSCRQRKEA